MKDNEVIESKFKYDLLDKSHFICLEHEVCSLGYQDEQDWQRQLKPCDNSELFAHEAVWVILNSGMKEQIARKIWDRIKHAWGSGNPTSTVFKHKGKVSAIEYIMVNQIDLFKRYQEAENKIDWLQTLPYIGKITRYHLAKNLGHDVVKPDRHLERVAKEYNLTPDELCNKISEITGEKKCVVDIIIWRACNLNIL